MKPRYLPLLAAGLLLTPTAANADRSLGLVPSVGITSDPAERNAGVLLGASLLGQTGALLLGATADLQACLHCRAWAIAAQIGYSEDFGDRARFILLGDLGWRWIHVGYDEDLGGGHASTSLPFAGARLGF